MQLSDLTSKTPEELNVMCAEALGWKGIEVYEDNQGPPITHGYPPPTVGVDAHGNWEAQPPKRTKRLPNYTGSWDAIMPVRDGLTDAQWEAYLKHLAQILDSQREPSDVTPMRLVRDLMRAELRLHVIALILTLTK